MFSNNAMVRKYATALYNVAVQKENVKEVNNRLNYIRIVLKKVPLFSQLLITHRVVSATKIAVLENVFGNKISEIEKDLISTLITNGHFVVFKGIVQRFDYLVMKDSDVIKINITSSFKFSKDEIIRIGQNIENKINKRLDFSTTMDPSLIGGIKLRVGNKLLDSSISGRLQKLRETLTQE